MDGCNRMMLRIGQQNGYAIGGLDSDGNAGRILDQRVGIGAHGLMTRRRATVPDDTRGMDLMNRHDIG